MGIPENDLNQLFDSRDWGSYVGAIRGRVLGLFIVKSLVDLSGVQIKVNSQAGAGTKFTVTILDSS